MKRFFAVLLLILFLASPVMAFRGFVNSFSTGEITADGAAVSSDCYLVSILVITDGSNDAMVILYDNASAASGTKLAEIKVNASDNYGGRNWPFPVKANNGIYADLTGTGASCIVEYIPR